MVKFSQRPPCKEPITACVVTCRAGLLQTFQFTLDYRSQAAYASVIISTADPRLANMPLYQI